MDPDALALLAPLAVLLAAATGEAESADELELEAEAEADEALAPPEPPALPGASETVAGCMTSEPWRRRLTNSPRWYSPCVSRRARSSSFTASAFLRTVKRLLVCSAPMYLEVVWVVGRWDGGLVIGRRGGAVAMVVLRRLVGCW